MQGVLPGWFVISGKMIEVTCSTVVATARAGLAMLDVRMRGWINEYLNSLARFGSVTWRRCCETLTVALQ
jgi:hypothetical protein